MPNYNNMTPITEKSFMDRHSFGMSSIAHERIRDQDDYHTVNTLGDRTFVTMSDRTISTVQHDSSLRSLMDEAKESRVSTPYKDEIAKIMEDSSSDEEDLDEVSAIKSRIATPAKAFKNVGLLLEKNEFVGEFGNPCNPRSKAVADQCADTVFPKVKLISSFVDCRSFTFNHEDKFVASLEAGDDYEFSLQSDGPYNLLAKLGEGGYAKVYLIESEDDDQKFALKIQSPANVWECFVINKLHSLCNNSVRESIISVHSCYMFSNLICLKLPFFDQGTLLTCINRAPKGGYGVQGATGADELLALFWAAELLDVVTAIHANGIIHGDLKADNILVRVHGALSYSNDAQSWEAQYDPNGENGWSSKGLTILDWGSAIDTNMFPPEQRFLSTKEYNPKKFARAHETDSYEYRNKKEWKYDPDWYALAGIFYVTLFGTYMKLEEDYTFESSPRDLSISDIALLTKRGVPHLRLARSLKRYWQCDLWTRIFDLLLNSGSYNYLVCKDTGAFGLTDEIKAIRLEIEEWLVLNCNKSGKSLRNLLRKIEADALENSDF